MKSVLFIILFVPVFATSQTLMEDSRIGYQISSDVEVVLYSTRDCRHCYYYLPTDLRISRKSDNSLEVSLVTWKNDRESLVIGGILHLLVTWGLTVHQEKLVRDFLIRDRDSLAVIMGPAMLFAMNERLAIRGKDKLGILLNNAVISVPLTPTTPGSKAALSFRFTEEEIGHLLYYIKNPDKTTTALEAGFSYEVLSANGLIQKRRLVVSLPFKEILAVVRV